MGDPQLPSRPGAVFLVLLIFVVIGPAVGTIMAVPLIMLNSGSLSEISQIIWIIVGLAFGGLWVGYFFGGIPAALAGLIIGIKEVYFGGAGWPFVLGVGALVGIAPIVHFSKLPASASNWKVDIGLCVVTTLSTVACWSIIRALLLDQPDQSEVKP